MIDEENMSNTFWMNMSKVEFFQTFQSFTNCNSLSDLACHILELQKLSRDWKKFLTSSWTLKLIYASHIQDLMSSWKSFEFYAKHMSRALDEITIKFTSDHQSLVDAYAQHQLSTKKHWWTTWRWVSHFAYVAHTILRRNSACSKLRITWAIACWWACHKLILHVLMHMLSIYRRIFARLAIHDIELCMICDCAIFLMLRSSCAYARLQYFAQAVCFLATLAK